MSNREKKRIERLVDVAYHRHIGDLDPDFFDMADAYRTGLDAGLAGGTADDIERAVAEAICRIKRHQRIMSGDAAYYMMGRGGTGPAG